MKVYTLLLMWNRVWKITSNVTKNITGMQDVFINIQRVRYSINFRHKINGNAF